MKLLVLFHYSNTIINFNRRKKSKTRALKIRKYLILTKKKPQRQATIILVKTAWLWIEMEWKSNIHKIKKIGKCFFFWTHSFFTVEKLEDIRIQLCFRRKKWKKWIVEKKKERKKKQQHNNRTTNNVKYFIIINTHRSTYLLLIQSNWNHSLKIFISFVFLKIKKLYY